MTLEDKRNDELILEVESLSRELASTKEDLEKVQKTLGEERQGKQHLETKLKEKNDDVEKKEEVHRRLSVMQNKVEEDLRRLQVRERDAWRVRAEGERARETDWKLAKRRS